MAVRTRALLLKKVSLRESDALLTLFTPELGKITALARGAWRSRRRFSGTLEPIHTLRVELVERREDFELTQAELADLRLTLTQDLSALEAAGTLLGWLRKAAAPRQPDLEVWRLTEQCLDRLDQPQKVDSVELLARTGLLLLGVWGWGLELSSCVRCGKPCPPDKPAWADAAQGGIVCTACGGARLRIEAATRLALSDVALANETPLSPRDAALALSLVEAALAAHADIH
jgi:DNA repair protein RecO (recombination protein O)